MFSGLPQKKGYQSKEIAEIARIDEDTVTNYTKKYDESGLQGLLEENYHQHKIGCSQHPTIDQKLYLTFILFEVCLQLITLFLPISGLVVTQNTLLLNWVIWYEAKLNVVCRFAVFGNIETFTFGLFANAKSNHNVHELEGDK